MTDHAELRRLAEQISALTELNDKGVTAPRVPNAAIKLLSKSAAAVLALLDEIKALRDRAQQAETLIEHWKMRAASARNNTLEEVARKLEADGHRWAAIISAEIRAMKEG